MSANPDPAVALMVFAGAVVLAAAAAWTARRVAARLRLVARWSARERLEDGVKHLFTAEADGRTATMEGFAAAIGVSRERAEAIARDLERLDLAERRPDGMALTGEGRAHALRIVRSHRIWERYLADRTGRPPEEWHGLAERLEHRLGTEEVERLAASMGDPLYDPHGDPIPTAAGALPPARGVPLSSIGAGATVRVVHVEDEPERVYRLLASRGIGVGSRLRVEAIGSDGLRLVVEGRAVTIESGAAVNLTVEPVEEDPSDERLERLHALGPGEEGEVVRLAAQVQGAQRRRLLDLGVVPGTVVRAELVSLSGDPVAYRIRGAMIALRRAQADAVLIRRRATREAA